MSYAHHKGADQPAHPHSLVVCCLDSISSIAVKVDQIFQEFLKLSRLAQILPGHTAEYSVSRDTARMMNC